MKSNGFTLIEVCIGISLLSLILLLTLPPLVSSIQRQQSQQFILELSSDLMYTSTLARTQQTVFYLELLPEQKQYFVHSPYQSFQKKFMIPAGIQVSSNFYRNRISYNASGQISQGGTINVTDGLGRTIQLILQLSSGRFRLSYGP